MKLSQRIFSNTIGLSGSLIICRFLSFFLFLLIARNYGSDKFGQYTFALSFIELLAVFSDLGLSKIMIRDTARAPDDLNIIFGNMIILKSIYSAFTFILIYTLLHVLKYSQEVISVAMFFALRSIFNYFGDLSYSVLKGKQKMGFIPLINISETLIALTLGFSFLKNGFGIVFIALGFAIAAFLKLVSAYMLVFRNYLKPCFDLKLNSLFNTFKRGIPFGIGSILIRISTRIDSVLLSKMTTMSIVGFYNAAYNPVITLLFIPGTFNEAIFPVTAKFFKTSGEDFHKTLQRAFKYSVILGLPLATGIFALSEQIIILFYGQQYISSVLALKILIWTLASSFGTYIFTTTLNSANKEKTVTYIIMICTVFNIISNIILIPKYQQYGSSLVTFLTDVMFFALSYFAVKKYVFKPKVLRYLIKPAIASLGMFFVVDYLKNFILVLPIVCGAVSYILLLLILCTFDKTDLEILKKLINKKE